ncbi:MAG: aldehyde dehydrogenase family protein, partial [Thermoanaerobaculia bacterium]
MVEALIEAPKVAPVAFPPPVTAARQAQPAWSQVPLPQRLAVVRKFRHGLAEAALDLAATVESPQRQSTAETLTAEILPLLDACRFLEQASAELLAPRRLGRRRRPIWLLGSRVEL